MKINRDFQEFLKLLAIHKVKYLLVGAFVRAYYGRPRYTGVMDIFIETSKENAEKMILVLSGFGFADIGLKAEDFQEPDQTIQLGCEPVRIDILTGITGVEFGDAWKNKEITEIDGINVNILHRDDYIKNKKALGRYKDLADIEEIMESFINIKKD